MNLYHNYFCLKIVPLKSLKNLGENKFVINHFPIIPGQIYNKRGFFVGRFGLSDNDILILHHKLRNLKIILIFNFERIDQFYR